MGLPREIEERKRIGSQRRPFSALSDGGSVLFVLPWSPDHVGGVNEVVINLVRWFWANSPLRPELLVSSTGDRYIDRRETTSLGPVDWFDLPSPLRPRLGISSLVRDGLSYAYRAPRGVFRLARYFRRQRVCAINFHYPAPSALTLLLAKWFAGRSCRMVLSFHGSDAVWLGLGGLIRSQLWRTILRRCDAVVVCSSALAEEVQGYLPGVDLPIEVIHNGVDIAACRDAGRVTPLPEAMQGRRYIVNVATFEEKKGQDVLLASFREIAKKYTDLQLVLVGRSGPTQDVIEALAAEPGLSGRVMIYPNMPHDETLRVIAGAELFVLPSREEPFGIVVLEAACFDVPVVASRVGGVPEIIEDKVSGSLVPVGDPVALSGAVQALLQDRDLAGTYAGNLRDVVESRFTWDHAAQRYAKLFGVDERA